VILLNDRLETGLVQKGVPVLDRERAFGAVVRMFPAAVRVAPAPI
jgi:hypothetical protein